MDPEKKSLNFIFPTKYVIPKSLKFSHWLSEIHNQRVFEKTTTPRLRSKELFSKILPCQLPDASGERLKDFRKNIENMENVEGPGKPCYTLPKTNIAPENRPSQ